MKKLLSVLLVSGMIFSLAGCGSTGGNQTEAPEAQTEAPEALVEQTEAPEAQTEALVVDEAAKTVQIQAVATGKADSSIHLLVNEAGSNAANAFFTTEVATKDFYDALVQLGGVPGNNIALDAAGATILGSGLDVSISFDGQEYGGYDLINASETREMDVRFGGNVELNQEYATGCLLCMESCSLGIASDAAYAYCEEMEFVPSDKMPEAGTQVTFTFKVDDTALVVDEVNGTITLNAVSTGYADSTIHAIVNEEGANAGKAMLTTTALTKDFYDALKKLGAEDGNNIALDAEDGIIEGTDLDVTVENDGVTGAFADLVVASEARDMQIRFGGNIDVNQEYGTGCVMCLESCPAGITSDAAYQYKEEMTFGTSDQMPEAGQHIIVKFTVVK